MEFEVWNRRPTIPFKALQATEDNLEEIAALCGGKIRMFNSPKRPCILLPNYKTEKGGRHNMLFVGDWLIENNRGFKTYKDDAFRKYFIRVDEDI